MTSNENLAMDIVEIFEEFLEDKGIDIPNEEKEQSESPSIIYGSDFGDLVKDIADLLDFYRG